MIFRHAILSLALALLLAGCSQDQSAKKAVELDTDTKKVSYVLGTNVGGQFKVEDIAVDTDAFMLGFRDALDAVEPRLGEEETIAALQAFQQEQITKQQEAMAVAGEANQKEGNAYLAANAAKEGVSVTESGLQYRELESGEGASPNAEDVVEVHYRGTLIDGTEFDSSIKRGVPAQFGVNQVIPGWTEALQLMQVGDKWELAIPPQLAYGPGGTGGAIGPNQTLLFEVELLAINPGDEAEEAVAEGQE